MPHRLHPIFLLLTLLTGIATANAQTNGKTNGQADGKADGRDLLQQRFDAYRGRFLQEKLFVHTDRDDYLAGEICWFKIWCMDGSIHRPLDVSKIAYVEILNRDDRPVLQAKISLEQAEGSGSLYLPITLPSGYYRLRAYTNWMKNTGPDYFFEKTIAVFNTLRTPGPLPPPSPDPPSDSSRTLASDSRRPAVSINFFPEGGNLVKDLSSTIAFRAIGPDGRGADCNGIIVDERQDTVALFRSLRYGIGRLTLRPSGDHVYKALVRCSDGTTIVKDLPPAADRGYTLSLNDPGNGSVKITVHARQPSGQLIYLFGQSRQITCINTSATMTDDSALFTINRDSLGMGITQLTVFDAGQNPVCERLYFKRPARRLLIGVTTDSVAYTTRSKVNLDISTGAEAGRLLPASLSLSVHRLDSLQPDQQQLSFYDYLWLGSDLKGRIESPEYYFSASGPAAEEALDNLMLTHGWRRWTWSTVQKDRLPPFLYHPEFNGQLISGRLTDAHTGLPVRDRISYLSVPGQAFQFYSAKTDSAGRFLFDVKNFYGSEGIIIQTGTQQDSLCRVDVFNAFSEQYSAAQLPPFTPPATWQHIAPHSSLLRRSIGMQAQNIYSPDSLRQFIAPSMDTLHFFGRPDYTYRLDDYTRFTTIEEVLREYVREINVGRLHGQKHLLMLNEPHHEFFRDETTLVLLDGIPVPDDRIFSYDPLKIKKLEVIPRLYYMGPSTFGGIASFSTYQGNYEGLELDNHSISAEYEGLQWKREFYSPEYPTPQQKDSWLPDLRDLLFWSGDIHTDGSAKKKLSFYTSDLPGKYMVTVQGLTAEGQAGCGTFIFEVVR